MGHMVVATYPEPHWLRCNPLTLARSKESVEDVLPSVRWTMASSFSDGQTSLDAQVLGSVGWGGIEAGCSVLCLGPVV